MSIISHNKAVLAHKRLKEIVERGATKKTIVFVIAGTPTQGAYRIDIQYPYPKGKIVEVLASCNEEGEDDTVISLQRSTEDDFENKLDNWSDVTDFTIVGGEKAIKRDVTSRWAFKGDYFRLFVKESGGCRNITVEVVIDVDVDI